MPDIQHLVVMGVSGSGKTTVARILAERLGWPYAEADEFHPQVNIDKMAAGHSLTDEDRLPWLITLRDWLTAHTQASQPTIITCSALKFAYRDVLRGAAGRLRFVHLDGSIARIGERMAARSDHFMPPDLLRSQFETLEPLDPQEDGIVVPVGASPQSVADTILRTLGMDAADRPDRQQ